MFRSTLRHALLALLLLAPFAPTQAAVTIHFLSRDFGETFPHAFIELGGTIDADPARPIDANYGFTATSSSPAVLLGSVPGEVISVSPAYRRKSQRHFSVRLTDAQYAQVMDEVHRWETLPGKSYNLNRRNCVHFVAAVARLIGLSAADDPRLMKKPRSFLEQVTRTNPTVDLAAASLPAPAVKPVAGDVPARD